MVALSLLLLYPPKEKLKGGIDLVGGTSLLFEIDTTGLPPADQGNLSERVLSILRERVDPKSQLNLEWRPVGNTRLEIRMPRPPKEALERRAVYNQTIEQIEARNIVRFDVERALNAAGEERATEVQELERGVAGRGSLIEAVSTGYDEYVAAQGSADTAAVKQASDKYEQAMSALLATNLPIRRLEDLLALGKGVKRDEELARIRSEYPAFDSAEAGQLITQARSAYDAWSKNKADLEDPSDLKRLLRGAGVLEFRILAARNPGSPDRTDGPVSEAISKYEEQLAKNGPRARANDRFIWIPVEDLLKFTGARDQKDFEARKQSPNFPIVEEYAGRHYVLMHDDPEFKMVKGSGGKSWSLREAYPDRNPMTGENVVSFRLDPRGGQLFGDLTEANVNRELCIVLDGAAMSYANINERITERGQISGRFTTDKVQNLVRILEAGSLPARLKETPLMENTIGPSLGESNRERGIRSAVYGFMAVVVFMLFYYGFAGGGMANVALLLNLLFTLSIMVLLQATFTVPGIAGLILTIGMAVDANVLIFERVREERERGVAFRRALQAGYEKAFSAIFDSNLTTLLTSIILGAVGSEEIKGFAITLGIGICTSMYTALVVTRLVFETLTDAGWLKDFSMRRLITVPNIDWMGMRSVFWTASIAAVAGSVLMFLWVSTVRTERLYDIEFLGGTSVQIDLKPGVAHSDDELDALITGSGNGPSAAAWLAEAAKHLEAATAASGEAAGQFTLTSAHLTAEEIAALMRGVIEDRVERGGIRGQGRTAVFEGKPGALDLASFQKATADAAAYARAASFRLQSARVQRVGEGKAEIGLSYEVVTIETNRDLVQAAVLGVLGDDLAVQQSLAYTTVVDEDLTKEPFFAVEPEDQYLSDVIGGEARFDVRRFRGGVAVEVVLDSQESPLAVEELDRRLREIGLLPEFEEHRTRELGIFPIDGASVREDGKEGHRRFAVLTVDDALRHEEDPDQWLDALARPHVAKIEAALGQEKSFSKVVQFAPQVAGQARNKATFAVILSLIAIVAYLWLRFGTKEYGLAAIVALVNDVAVTLGLVTVSHFVYNNFLGRAVLLEPFRIDLSMIASILTVIGYSINDKIVIFDRIRENKGRIGTLDAKTINNSINQTLSRTLLTGTTTVMVLFLMYAIGGKAVHGFSFSLLIGVLVGTYSSIAIGATLLYQPRVLHAVVVIIATLSTILVLWESTPRWPEVRWVLVGLSILAGAYVFWRMQRGPSAFAGGRPVSA